MQVGAIVTYTPTIDENIQGQPQAALCTGWDADGLKASLIVFPAGAYYGYEKTGVVEGTDPGTWQAFVLSTGGASAASAGHDPTAKSNHEATKHEGTRRERQY